MVKNVLFQISLIYMTHVCNLIIVLTFSAREFELRTYILNLIFVSTKNIDSLQSMQKFCVRSTTCRTLYAQLETSHSIILLKFVFSFCYVRNNIIRTVSLFDYGRSEERIAFTIMWFYFSFFSL